MRSVEDDLICKRPLPRSTYYEAIVCLGIEPVTYNAYKIFNLLPCVMFTANKKVTLVAPSWVWPRLIHIISESWHCMFPEAIPLYIHSNDFRSVSNGFRFRFVGFSCKNRFRLQKYFESVSVSVCDFRFRFQKFYKPVSVCIVITNEVGSGLEVT